jgi:hypothetical protein
MIGTALNIGRQAACMLAVAALAITVSVTSQAFGQWSLRISDKEGQLAHTGDPMWNKWLMWDIGFQRMVDRNMPYVEITNESLVPITSFHLTIGDNRFNFAPVQGSNLAVLGSTSPAGVSITSHACTVNCQESNPADELVVDIGGTGLQPGQLVRFKIKMGIDPDFAATYAASFGSSLPDYRTVLFDINSNGGFSPVELYGPAPGRPNPLDNGNAFVFFGATKSTVDVFEDTVVDALGQSVSGQFRNNQFRPYSEMDAVNLFALEGAPIPEPTSIGLVMLGITGFFLSARWRSRPSVA